jgi:hypothetical protein
MIMMELGIMSSIMSGFVGGNNCDNEDANVKGALLATTR